MLIQTLNDDNSCPVYGFLRMDSPMYCLFVIGMMLANIPFFLAARRLALKFKKSLAEVSDIVVDVSEHDKNAVEI
jgi:hypothetical protein